MSRNLPVRYKLPAIVFAAILAGCAKLPIYQKPAAELPTTWKDVPAQGAPATGERWWTVYRDPVLEKLVDEGLARNRDLAIAAARIDEARALLTIADAERAPSCSRQKLRSAQCAQHS